jgi:hypothetical protein
MATRPIQPIGLTDDIAIWTVREPTLDEEIGALDDEA